MTANEVPKKLGRAPDAPTFVGPQAIRTREELADNQAEALTNERRVLPVHRTEAGYPNCSACDGGGCLDCTDPA